jgi:NADP-dependent 3-hydroxy acid dehydrogenase YdfG
MNRIILAHAPRQAALAQELAQKLGRIGIPFEHADAGVPGGVAQALAQTEEPVLLLITDNLLKERNALAGLLDALTRHQEPQKLLLVVADGLDAEDKPVDTHIDRMVNALHYMNFWQSAWLQLSDRYQHSTGDEKAALEAELDATRAVANQMGDLIGLFREKGYLMWPQFEANDYEAFFRHFGLADWHGQYKRLIAQSAENQTLGANAPLPETPLHSGILAPEPFKDPELPELLDEMEPEGPEAMPTAPEAAPDLSPLPTQLGEEDEEQPQDVGAQVEQAIRDAQFWLDRGHAERGLELLQLALEQYPDQPRLAAFYADATARHSPPPEAPPMPEMPVPPAPVEAPVVQEQEAKSYELMGDMAAEKGDYLFAKYCWDRASELHPALPGIYRKLGLMTSEHLRDYRETAVIYLHKALEMNALDADVQLALAYHALQNGNRMEAENWYAQAIETNPTLRNAEHDLAFSGQQGSPQPPETRPTEPLQMPAPPATVSLREQPKLVLVTGATSGIGRATAEIFAQHGYRLILTGRRLERLLALKNELEAQYHSDILLLPFDVRDPGATSAALKNLPENFRDIDILVNNAGLAKGLAPIHEGNLEHWETMIDTNVKGLLYVTRCITPGMVRRRSGHVINVGSSAGKEAYPNGNVYCATKFAVDALTKSMRFDLHGHNIRVSQVSPGHVEETEFALNRFDGDSERAKIYNDFQPLKSSDVAEVIFFMATRPAHVNIQDVYLFGTQQASSTVIARSGR